MAKEAVFTMKLESDLRADFMAETEALHRPASQVVRELMREFVERQRHKREHKEFVERKVAAARGSMEMMKLKPISPAAARVSPVKRESSVDAGGAPGSR
jgi:predicted transcriptional regulator